MRRGAVFVALLAVAGASVAVAGTAHAATSFRAVQMNLCNGGYDACYADGQVLAEAGDLIRSLAPDVVTLNEVCRTDVEGPLLTALAAAWPGDQTYQVFEPSTDRRTGAAYQCVTGDDYGVAVIGRLADPSVSPTFTRGLLASQDAGNEERGYACASVPGDHLACTAHPTPQGTAVALAQCRQLVSQIVPGIQATAARTVVGGDMNLRTGSTSTGIEGCVPTGWSRAGDGAVQHVIVSPDVTVGTVSTEALTHSDHDALVVDLTMP
jgi:endonuclease/exonuclease/phosphatase family metal-dependent hydrolase